MINRTQTEQYNHPQRYETLASDAKLITTMTLLGSSIGLLTGFLGGAFASNSSVHDDFDGIQRTLRDASMYGAIAGGCLGILSGTAIITTGIRVEPRFNQSDQSDENTASTQLTMVEGNES